MHWKTRWRLVKNRHKIRYLLFFLTDPKVSFVKKLWILIPFVYLLFPTDLIPDFIIGPGFIDDLLIILSFWKEVRRDLGQYIVKHSQKDDRPKKGLVREKANDTK